MFNCTKCGLCCQHVGPSGLPNVGGVCVEYDHGTKLCRVYETRPLICRVEEGYEAFFTKVMTKEEFYLANEEACRQLQSK